MNKYLAIDYGLVHVGLATAEDSLATPLPSLKNSSQLITTINTLIRQDGITHIVCGIPEGAIAKQVKKFTHKLTIVTQLPVILHPETLSTREAQYKLQQGGANRAKRRNNHSYAACLILEDYLEFNK